MRFPPLSHRMPLGGFAAALLFALGCGGGGLKYTVDDNLIAKVPLLERQALLAAQDNISQARSEQLASDERGRALGIERKRVEQAIEQAQARSNPNRDAAQAELDALSAKRRMVEQRTKATRLARHAADAHLSEAMARYELEKARLVQQKSLDKKLSLAPFESQWQSANAAFEAAKASLEPEAELARQREVEWRKAVELAEQKKGAPPGAP